MRVIHVAHRRELAVSKQDFGAQGFERLLEKQRRLKIDHAFADPVALRVVDLLARFAVPEGASHVPRIDRDAEPGQGLARRIGAGPKQALMEAIGLTRHLGCATCQGHREIPHLLCIDILESIDVSGQRRLKKAHQRAGGIHHGKDRLHALKRLAPCERIEDGLRVRFGQSAQVPQNRLSARKGLFLRKQGSSSGRGEIAEGTRKIERGPEIRALDVALSLSEAGIRILGGLRERDAPCYSSNNQQ